MEHNLNWPYIPDHPYRILIIGASGSGKANALLSNIDSIRSKISIRKIHTKQNINI